MMISVIMLTYNRRQYVRNMIEDILKQTYLDFEFIIVDNGSTDGTKDIVVEYAKNDERIVFFRSEIPLSIGKGRNIGLNMSRGNYITYVDDDDRVTEDYISFLYSMIEESRADISICGCSESDGKNSKPQCVFDEKRVISGVEATRLLINREIIRAGMPTKMYKREILEKYPFDEYHTNEDIYTQYKYLLASDRVILYGIDKYHILRHGSNISNFTSDASRWNASIMEDYLLAYNERTRFIKDNADELYLQAKYSEWAFMISMIDKIERYCLEDCREIQQNLRTILNENRVEFENMIFIKPFEKEWLEKYV